MTNELDADVVVVGAGPTGLTLAVGLARYGVRCRVVERSAMANTASKAKAIQLQHRNRFVSLAVTHSPHRGRLWCGVSGTA